MLAAAVLAAAVLLVLPDGAWAGGTGTSAASSRPDGRRRDPGLEVCVEATSEFHDYCHESESGGNTKSKCPKALLRLLLPEECPGRSANARR